MQFPMSILAITAIIIAAAASAAYAGDGSPNLKPIDRYRPIIKARNSTTSYIGELNITAFPSCAYTNCIASDLFSPSRLGCLAGTLTIDCFCNTAATPLSCAPAGPSDEENCWYNLENWFAGICGASVATIQPATMPECVQNCVLNYIIEQGCLTKTRNCFCKIDSTGLVNATTFCQARNCTSKMQSSFVPSSWRDNICSLGSTSDYDQASYNKYVKMVHDTRIAVPVVISLVDIAVVVGGVLAYTEEHVYVGVTCFVSAVVLLLITVVPVYTAL